MLTNNEANMEVIEPDKKAKKKGYTNSGHLSAKGVSIEHRPTFADVSDVYLPLGVCVHGISVCLCRVLLF
jgi:hypothetical protein